MTKLNITQYLRPDGRKKEIIVEIPDEYEKIIKKIKENSCIITCEQLTTGEAAQYITSEEYGDYDIQITKCGKEADKALLEMIKRFNEKDFKNWLKMQKFEG